MSKQIEIDGGRGKKDNDREQVLRLVGVFLLILVMLLIGLTG